MGFSGFLKNLWYTWENETPRCTRGFMGFSGFLKTSGTLGSMSLLGVLKVLWTSLDFLKPLVHFRGIMLLCVPEVYSFLLIFRGGTDF